MANYTEKAILSTFEEMLEEKNFDHITVTELVKRCDISPNTFYYHYQDINDLLDHWIKLKLDPYFHSELLHTSWLEGLRQLLYALKDHKILFLHVFDSLSRDQIEQYVFELSDTSFDRSVKAMAEGYEISEEQLKEITDFCHFAFGGFFLHFVWDHMEADIDEKLDRLANITKTFIQQSLEHYGKKDEI